VLIRGKAKWAKIFADQLHWGFENKHKEWSIDVYLDEETVHRLEVEGLKPKIKDKGNGPFITFKRRELKADGSPNQPVRIVDHHGNTLQDSETVYKGPKIGNDSVVNVNFAINEYGKNQKSANILSLQIWDMIKYDGDNFPVKEDAETDESWQADAA
jgi:hypothetical protein